MTLPAPSTDAVASLVDISIAYGQGARKVEVLCDINLELLRGEMIAVVGASGIGKTTLLRMLAGLIAPHVGAVKINGLSTRDAQRGKQLAYVPQSLSLLEWRTVHENIALALQVNSRHIGLAKAERDARVGQSLDAVGLFGKADAFPHELSGGQQQRVAFARAFAQHASILLLDEPFASLDDTTRSELRQLLRERFRLSEQTCVVVTHHLDDAVMLADRVVVLAGKPATISELIEVGDQASRPREIDESQELLAKLREVRAALEEAK